MQMDILRCKTPELVRKEVWTHNLAYNLIRTIIAQAAIKRNIEPRTISFKGAIQTLEAFQSLFAVYGDRDRSLRDTCRSSSSMLLQHIVLPIGPTVLNRD